MQDAYCLTQFMKWAVIQEILKLLHRTAEFMNRVISQIGRNRERNHCSLLGTWQIFKYEMYTYWYFYKWNWLRLIKRVSYIMQALACYNDQFNLFGLQFENSCILIMNHLYYWVLGMDAMYGLIIRKFWKIDKNAV